MTQPVRLRTIAALSLAITYLFFIDYLPPFRRVHIPFDLDGYHYPLLNYAFQALRDGRFPEWDAAQYCGISLVGNPQVALFYPPVWILFAANMGRQALSYQSLQDLVFVHVWLAFILCYCWLRHKRLNVLPSVLGAQIFALSGYMMMGFQHLGLVIGYAWMPLGFWGIDQAIEERNWRPLWRLVAASAFCLLGGYTPTWAAFVVCALIYAACHWKTLIGAALAIIVSLALAMVQILPTLEALSLKAPEVKYGSGVKTFSAYASHLVPNYYNFGLGGGATADENYLYLGVPAVFGLMCLIGGRLWRDLRLFAGVLAVTLLIASNPFNLVWALIGQAPLLPQIFRDWYFLQGFALAAAPLAAVGLDHFLRGNRIHRLGGLEMPRWLGWIASILLLAASGCLLTAARSDALPSGLGSVVATAFDLALFGLATFALRSQCGRQKAFLTASLLLMVLVEYQVYGTGRRFNAAEGVVPAAPVGKTIPGMDPALYAQLREHPEYRIALDGQPFPYEIRIHGLRTAEGFDPFLTTQYRLAAERAGTFRTDRELDIDPDKTEGLRLLGIRYFITHEGTPRYNRLASNPAFELMQPSDWYHYYKVFQLRDPRPTYGWAGNDPASSARAVNWTPERRNFWVHSPNGGRFTLSEQLFPGWQATVDGVPARIEQWEGAFQAVQVPAGKHQVEFRFRSRGLRTGAIASGATLLALCCGLLATRRRSRGLHISSPPVQRTTEGWPVR